MHAPLLLPSLGLALVMSGSAAAGQHEGHQAGAAVPSAAQVGECRQAQPVVTELLNAALKRLEDARLTNSAAAMRDAADDVQAALVDMRTQLAPCAVMQAAVTEQPAAATTLSAPTPAPPAATPAAADQHAGHVMPGVSQAPDVRGRPVAPTQRPAVPPASAGVDSHAGHVMPMAPARRPSTAKESPAVAAIGDDARAGHAAAIASTKEAASSVGARPSAPAPPTSIADLKCPNAIDPRTVPRILYQGRMYYFCTEASRSEFAKDPAKFVTAPPQTAPAHAH